MRQTSIEALVKVSPHIPSIKERIMVYFISKEGYGATDQEIENALFIPGNTVRPTRISLLKDGIIVNSGMTRMNKNGNRCIVYVANNSQGELF
jgi:hypothetical protein